MEFQEVMRETVRMCKSINEGCAICPLQTKYNGCNKFCTVLARTNPADYEKIVAQWAAAHPKPVYPTWYEWLFNTIRAKNDWPVDDHEFCKWLDENRIPDDIAEKLGIEPKINN